MENPVLKEATFNPAVKTYIFIIALFYMVITVIGLVFVPFWLFGLGQWLTNKFFHTLKCQLSYKNLKFSKGIILHIEKTIPLENIQDVSFIGGPILRAFGLTMIKVETAGGGGPQQSNMMSMIGLNDAEEFKDMILHQREIIMREKATGYSSKALESKDGEEAVLLNEIKKELVQIKEILRSKN